VEVYFGPVRPKDAKNFIQTIPNKGWKTLFRLYGPLEPWFDKTGFHRDNSEGISDFLRGR
jgi:hypothetical protein